MMWVSQGEVTDPETGAILADTGPQPSGITAAILVSSSVGFVVELVRRNALNTADVHVHPFQVAGYVPFVIPGVPLGMSVNERVLLRVKEGFSGIVTGSILS